MACIMMQAVVMMHTVAPDRNVDLSTRTSIGLGGPADYLWSIADASQLQSAMSQIFELGHQPFVMGGGSNLVVSDHGVRESIISLTSSHGPRFDHDLVVVEGGYDWDRFVSESVQAGRSGVELLSGIPGRVGAAPIQNIGAYGQEVSHVIEWVDVVWLDSLRLERFSKSACGFEYRTSVFKSQHAGRLVVTQVGFRLGRASTVELRYKDLVDRLGSACAPTDGRAAVLDIRANKGMTLDHGHGYSSAGSFFMNPVISNAAFESLSKLTGTKVPSWATTNQSMKLAAAWLIERAGFVKGQQLHSVGISPRHALSLVNFGTGCTTDLLKLAVTIQTRVFEHLGVWLVMEPVLLGDGLEPFRRLKSERPLIDS